VQQLGVARKKEKIQERQKPENEGHQASTLKDFERAKEGASNGSSPQKPKDLQDYYFLVTKNEFDYRESKMGSGRFSSTPKYRVRLTLKAACVSQLGERARLVQGAGEAGEPGFAREGADV
jgi:hypothetical protein